MATDEQKCLDAEPPYWGKRLNRPLATADLARELREVRGWRDRNPNARLSRWVIEIANRAADEIDRLAEGEREWRGVTEWRDQGKVQRVIRPLAASDIEEWLSHNPYYTGQKAYVESRRVGNWKPVKEAEDGE